MPDIRRHRDERIHCAQGEYFRDPTRFVRCTMRARAGKAGPIGRRGPVSKARFRVPDAIPISRRAAPVHAYSPMRRDRGCTVRCDRDPVANSQPGSRKITTNRKVSRYGSEFRTCHAQAKFCESAHPAARLDESGTLQFRTGERFRERLG